MIPPSTVKDVALTNETDVAVCVGIGFSPALHSADPFVVATTLAVAVAESGAGSDLVDGLFHGARIAFIIGGILATIAVICAPFIKAPKRA